MVTYQQALFIVSFSHLPQINYLLTVVTVRNESNDATEEMTDHVVTEKEAEIHSRRLSRLCQVIQQEWWGTQACMLHPRCMHGGGKVRLSRGHERRGAGGVQQALHHTQDHARGELRLWSEVRPAQLRGQAQECARDEQLHQQARYQVSLQLQDHQN